MVEALGHEARGKLEMDASLSLAPPSQMCSYAQQAVPDRFQAPYFTPGDYVTVATSRPPLRR